MKEAQVPTRVTAPSRARTKVLADDRASILARLARQALGEDPVGFADSQSAIPALARDRQRMARIDRVLSQVPTGHLLRAGDARDLRWIPDASVHLVLTSPPYWTLKRYNAVHGQLGHVESYDAFIAQLTKVWSECLRVLVPGGRLIIVVGDVCLSRRRFGRHLVMPLHSTIQESCRVLGFDNLAPIIWYKIANAKYEAGSIGGFLGKPYEPNAVVKNDVEFILMQRKPGAYRTPTAAMRVLSTIASADHSEWFQQVWQLAGASTRTHPAPFPLSVAERLVRMFSFVGDTVLDPFVGTGTTCLAAARSARDSIGVEIDPAYLEQSVARLKLALDALEGAALR